MLRTQDSVVTVKTATPPCGDIKGKLIVSWTKLSGVKNEESSTSHLIDINQENPNKINIKGSELKSGYTYQITGTVRLDGYSDVKKSSTVYFDVVYSPLVAVITPPGTRTVGMEDIVVLDGASSFDPDQDGAMGYKWFCSNCPDAVNAILNDGSSTGIGLSSGLSQITIPKGMLPQGTTYQFGLHVTIVGSTSRLASRTVYTDIEVQSGDPPNVYVKSPPVKYPNVNEPMVIEAQVYSCCKLADFKCPEYSAVWNGTGLVKGGMTTFLSKVSIRLRGGGGVCVRCGAMET